MKIDLSFRPKFVRSFQAISLLSLSLCLSACKDKAAPISTEEVTEKESADQAVKEEEKAITNIACGSCYKPTSKHANLWNAIAATKPELFLFMGDNIYGDTEDMAKLKEKYAKLTKLPSYQQFAKKYRVIPVWDDHDYGKNDAGVEYPKKVESQKIFQDVFGFSKDHPARKRKGIYHSYVQGPEGKRLQIINLDTRYHRSPLKSKKVGRRTVYVPNLDPNATMLGEEQWQWLEEQLMQPADLRIIVSSIQIITGVHIYEKWSNIPAERKRFFDLLKKTNCKRVILLSGDRHLAEFARIKPEESGLEHDVIEMTSSGMTHANAGDAGNPHRIENSYFKKRNFGSIEIDWNKKNAPKVTLKIMKIHDDNSSSEVFRKKEIQFQ